MKQKLVITVAVCAVVLLPLALGAQQDDPIHGREGIVLPAMPVAAVHPVTDDYFGTKIVDNYRWLEDAKSPETRAWIDEENAYTQKYLSQAKILPEIKQGLTVLERVDEYTVPTLRGGKYFFEKRLADENQASIYMREGWTGQDVRLIDATKLSADQNTSVLIRDISEDGGMLVYGIQQGGADEEEIHFLRVKERSELPIRSFLKIGL